MNIFIKDPYRMAVEGASGGRNTVIYDDFGIPSQMVIIPRFDILSVDPTAIKATDSTYTPGSPNYLTLNFPEHDLVPGDVITLKTTSSDTNYDEQTFTVDSTSGDDVTIEVSADLSNYAKRAGVYLVGQMGYGWHPAFCGGGVDDGRVYNEIMIGQFKSCRLNNKFYSLPRMLPDKNRYEKDYLIDSCITKGDGWHPVNQAEWSAIMLWVLNNNKEYSTTYPGGPVHESIGTFDERITYDDNIRNMPYSYTCPWETGSSSINSTYNPDDMYTGSGPNSWRHDGSTAGIHGLISSRGEYVAGIEIDTDGMVLCFNKINNAFIAGQKIVGNTNVIICKPTANKCDIFGLSGSDSPYDGYNLSGASINLEEFPFYSSSYESCDISAALKASVSSDVVEDLKYLRMYMLSSDLWRRTPVSDYTDLMYGNISLDDMEDSSGDSRRFFVRGSTNGNVLRNLQDGPTNPGIYAEESMFSWYTVLDGSLPAPRLAYVRG